jgi:hypothetical protein
MHHAAFYSKFIGFSMDAGTEAGYQRVKRPPDGAWNRVLGNIRALTTIIHQMGLRNDVGWKILVLPDTQNEIYESCRLAKDLGCRYVQIRPADLPPAKRGQINVNSVTGQIQRAIDELEEPGTFEVVGIRHKFTPDMRKVLPCYCHLTPLTVTVTSDGKAYACVDRRCDPKTMLVDCSTGGWTALSDVWGSVNHITIVHYLINRNGLGPACNIRCSNFGYDKYFNNYFVQDNVDWKLI